MIDRTTKLRLRRTFRRRKRQVEGVGALAEENLEKLFIRRLVRLTQVRRFMFSWLLLVLVLIGGVVVQTRSLDDYYQKIAAVPGGIYTEGILGTFTNANPVYASGAVDSAVSRLLFSGLMRYDDANNLVTDLAASIAVDDTETIYTLQLRDDVLWHDGEQFSSDDVVYTYRIIQNPDARSPLLISWQDVKVSADGPRTVIFTLPNPLTSFPHSLTNGIVPQHLLKDIEMTQMRASLFNTANPVGTGPFEWDTIEVKGDTAATREERIGLLPNKSFHRGSPELDYFVIRALRSEERLLSGIASQELFAISGIENVPDTHTDRKFTEYNVPVASQVSVFMKTSQQILSDDKVRRALTHATNQPEIVSGIGYPVIPSKSPLLQSHLGYDDQIVQLPYDIEAAKALLDEAGWVLGGNNIRSKDGKPLVLQLYSQSNSEYTYISQELQKQWAKVGVQLQVNLQNANDLQTALADHRYDILLYGISLGVDPDVFAYWHSSQATPRSGAWLNFSEYQSAAADDALEAGRTRSDDTLRAVKYKPFLEAWRNDAPSISLYQPRFLYVTRKPIANFNPTTINTANGRYASVEQWMIRDGSVLR